MLSHWLFHNPAADAIRPYPAELRDIVSLQRLDAVETALAACPAHRPTPLRALPALARELGVGRILYKDESARFGFGAFKALGGVYAVGRQLLKIVQQHTGRAASFAELAGGVHAAIVQDVTVTAASSGNHGRAVAAGARLFGCRCTIVLPSFTSAAKEAAIRARGAAVVRIDGDYDQSLEACRGMARERNWQIISDTSWPGYTEIPRDVMQAYGVIAAELLRQLPEATAGRQATHLFLQAGVGGLAAGVAGTIWEASGRQRPTIVVVEPASADCFLQSARAGRPMPASGDAVTSMGGLACREISTEAWPILQQAADWFCTVPEDGVPASLKCLALPSGDDRPIAAGPSGSAGLQALLRLASDRDARQAIGLDGHSVVVLIGSEGAAGDPDYFHDAVGLDVGTVEARAADWDRRHASSR